MQADEVTPIEGVRALIPLEIFRPKGAGPWPAVLVLHEIVGLNADIRRIARRFAENGFLAACPDLMADGGRIACIRSSLDSLRRGEGPQIVQLKAALDALRARDDTSEIGVAGFCLGGGFATLLATRERVGAAAIFYGDIRPREELKRSCPIVGGYGTRDKAFLSKGMRLQERLTEYGIPNDIKFYDGVGHSFMNRAVPPYLAPLLRPFLVVGYNEQAAEDSWSRMLAFFGEHLRESASAAVVTA